MRADTAEVEKQHVLQFALPSISSPVLVRNVFYEFDKANLTENSCEALDRLTKMLKENPNVTIELSAHCDYRGNADYNLKLSQRRAESVVRYLTEHGIAADRLTARGYGKEVPKVVNAYRNVSVPSYERHANGGLHIKVAQGTTRGVQCLKPPNRVPCAAYHLWIV